MHLCPIAHKAFGKRVLMAAAEVADVSGRPAQRKRVIHGNMRAKLSDYIGQVFECKADSRHYPRTFAVNPRWCV
jgi:hypothetical protein